MPDQPDKTLHSKTRYNRYLWYGVSGIVLLVFIVFVAVSFSDLPGFDDLENPKYDLASVIYDAKGQPYGRYYIEDRVAVTYDDLSEKVKTHY